VRSIPNGGSILSTLANETHVLVEGKELDRRGRLWYQVVPDHQENSGWVYRNSLRCWCYPRDVTTRVLASQSPNDIHKRWSGKNHIGLDWKLDVKETINGGNAVYLTGNLYSPGSGSPLDRPTDKGVYGLSSEWTCE
jgi:hypothetical protein